MITYGRNDNYGLNLHKRAALSLNCLAEVLDAPGDEILFVDYNTPDELPSFPEAIADTLTPRARAMLRILRIRPHIHRRYTGLTHLPVIEPVARNAALRRSNPTNRWILSTNTDMIFAPAATGGLSTIAASLADGYYHLPRFELPQSLWESLDRRDPRAAIARAIFWSRALSLSEVVRNGWNYILYDGPGDFQLMLRANLLRIHGFDERILLGWHVDANIAKRLSLLHGPSGDLAASLSGYHCEHTRGLTPKHLAGRPENDFTAVVERVTTPFIEEQSKSFGLADDTLEEIRLGEGEPPFFRALAPDPGAPALGAEALGGKAQGAATGRSPGLTLEPGLFDRIDYDACHVLPFLMDVLASYPHDMALGWFGAKRALLDRAVPAWRGLGFTRTIRVAAPAPWLGAALPEGAVWCAPEEIVRTVTACVFDFGWPDGTAPGASRGPTRPEHAFVLKGLRTLAAAEAAHRAAAPPCRVIAVNASNNRFTAALSTHAAVTLSPVTTRIRQGLIRPMSEEARALLPLMWAAEAGRRLPSGNAIAVLDGIAGIVCAGPNLDLLPGRYRLTLDLDAVEPASDASSGNERPEALTLHVSSGDIVLARLGVSALARGRQSIALDFGITEDLARVRYPLGIEAVLRTAGQVRAVLGAVSLARLPGTPKPPAAEHEWLPEMNLGSGEWVSRGWKWRQQRVLRIEAGKAGHVVFGPYVGLIPGDYEVAFTLETESAAADLAKAPIVLDVRAGVHSLASREVAPTAKGRTVWRLPITVEEAVSDANGRMALEFRVWTDGSLPFAVLSVRTRCQSGMGSLGAHPSRSGFCFSA